MRVHAMKGGASGGTIASMLNLVEEASKDKELRRLLADPYALNPVDLEGGRPNLIRPDRPATAIRSWMAPFVMASVNTAWCSAPALLGRPWGAEFRYDEAMAMGSGPFGAAKATGLVAGLGAGMGAMALGPTRKLLKRALPKPGDGPDPEAQRAGFFDLRFRGTTPSGRTADTQVTGDRDLGYGATSRMIGETALALLELPAREERGGGSGPLRRPSGIGSSSAWRHMPACVSSGPTEQVLIRDRGRQHQRYRGRPRSIGP
ncbi:MAG: hypothetical protein R2789_14900 [Microthrixaceae bacterium]